MIERDPISGNEVPPGAEPKEVRDDVDAKLSDGEYVLPADVVRFYGVQYIEKMVMKAKEGMNEMVANGRVNGKEPTTMNGKADPRIASRDPRQQAPQPVPRQMSGGGYNFLPQDGSQQVQYPAMTQDGLSAAEELRKRQEAPVEMAEGGYTSAANQIMGNQSYGTGANQILNTGGISGFDAVRSTGRGFYGTNAVGGAGSMGSGGVETRTYINKAGERISVMFINGTPIANIPDGYVPDTPEGRKQFEEAVVGSGEDVASPEVDEDGRDNRESNNWKDDETIAPEDNYYTMSPEDLGAVKDMPKGIGGKALAGMGIAGAAVGAVNAAMQGDHIADLRARATIAAERGLGELADELNAKADAALEAASPAVKGIAKAGGLTGNQRVTAQGDAMKTYTVGEVEKTWLGQNGGIPNTGVTGSTTPVDSNGTPISGGSGGSGVTGDVPYDRTPPGAGPQRSREPGSGIGDFFPNRAQAEAIETYVPAGLRQEIFGNTTISTEAPITSAQLGRIDQNTMNQIRTSYGPQMPERTSSTVARSAEGDSQERRDNERDVRDSQRDQAAQARENSTMRSNDVIDNAVARGASDAELGAIEKERDRIDRALDARASGASVGFAKGGLVARKAMRNPNPRRKIRTVER